jgi:hypothetical protein
MKRFLALLAVAAIGAVMYVTAAPGGLQATGPTARQFAALKKQVAGLSNTVKTLKGQLAALKTDEAAVKVLATTDDGFIQSCLIAGHVVGISRYGDPSGTYGYSYQDSTAHTSLTSALDADASSTPNVFFQGVAASCVSSGSAASHNGNVPTERRTSALAATKR